MSSQPTGDYRLVPWAYPPIPGGSNNSTAPSGNAFDFSNAVVSYRSQPGIVTLGSDQVISGYGCFLNGVEAIDTSRVSQITYYYKPSMVRNVNGLDITAAINNPFEASDPTIPVANITNGLTLFSGPMPTGMPVLKYTTVTGNCQQCDMELHIVISDASGAMIQEEVRMVSI